ncbi:MAG: type VI secretion system contractile sheath domain-containing protein [Desulfomonilia bacterium]
MTEPITFGKLEFRIGSPGDEPFSAARSGGAFRILIMGDFSGRENRGIIDPESIPRRRITEVDRDTIEEVMERMKVEIRFRIAGTDSPEMSLTFSEPDDFHPDAIFDRFDMFRDLKETRRKLDDPRTFEAAAREVRTWAGGPGESDREEEAPEKEQTLKRKPAGGSGSLLDQIIGEEEAPPQSAERLAGSSDWDRFLRRIVAPHSVSGDDTEKDALMSIVDASVSALMGAILHQVDVQALEAAWRSLHFLVSRVETGEDLKISIVDISQEELSADLCGTDDLTQTGVYRLLVEQTVDTPGAEPWSVLAGLYSFSTTQEDADLLGRIAKIARRTGAPFLAHAHEGILGCRSLVETPDPRDWTTKPGGEDERAWQALRALDEASYLGLALPRFILRLPYGPDTDPVDRFEYEEIPDGSDHEAYLWGNPAIACTLLMAQAFTSYGWGFRPGVVQDIEDLPLVVFTQEGERELLPCAEVLLTEDCAEVILDHGVMPLVSIKGTDRIRLVRFQSIAEPPTPLGGRWE